MNSSNIKRFIERAPQVGELLKKIAPLGVTCLSVLERSSCGKVQYFSSSSNWIRDYYEKELYRSSEFDKKQSSLHKLRYVIWPENSPLEVYQYAREYYDSDHGMTLTKSLPHAKRFYFFSGARNTPEIRQHYLNHQDVFERFSCYFDQALRLEPECFSHNIASKMSESKRGLYANMPINLEKVPLQSGYSKTYFTPSEWRCIQYMMNHFTATEIAAELGLSVRTVETHFNHIKQKVGLPRKSELLEFVLQFSHLFSENEKA